VRVDSQPFLEQNLPSKRRGLKEYFFQKPGMFFSIIIGFVILCGLIMLGVTYIIGGGIRSLDDLRLAINEKRAINCVVSYQEDGYKYRIQTNNGWGKVMITVLVEGDEASQQKTLSIKDDYVYMWSQDGSSDAGKWPYSDIYYSELVDEIVSGDYDDDITINCQAANDRDLAVPAGIDFHDLTEDNTGDDLSGDGSYLEPDDELYDE